MSITIIAFQEEATICDAKWQASAFLHSILWMVFQNGRLNTELFPKYAGRCTPLVIAILFYHGGFKKKKKSLGATALIWVFGETYPQWSGLVLTWSRKGANSSACPSKLSISWAQTGVWHTMLFKKKLHIHLSIISSIIPFLPVSCLLSGSSLPSWWRRNPKSHFSLSQRSKHFITLQHTL